MRKILIILFPEKVLTAKSKLYIRSVPNPSVSTIKSQEELNLYGLSCKFQYRHNLSAFNYIFLSCLKIVIKQTNGGELTTLINKTACWCATWRNHQTPGWASMELVLSNWTKCMCSIFFFKSFVFRKKMTGVWERDPACLTSLSSMVKS